MGDTIEKSVKELLDKFTDTVVDVCAKSVKIVIGNPLDLLNLDLSNFDTETYFISNPNMAMGKMAIVSDKETKRDLYRFCVEHEDRVFRGTKRLDTDRE